MTTHPHTAEKNEAPVGTFRSYALGFALSLLLTCIAFGLAAAHLASHHAYPSHEFLQIAFLSLALVQLLVQAVFFLHLKRGTGRHWNTISFAFAGFIAVVVVAGSLWIMANLHDMSLSQLYLEGAVSPQTELQ